MMTAFKPGKKLYAVLSIMAGLFFLGVLLLLIFAQEALSQFYRQPYLLPNWALVVVMLAVLAAVALIRGRVTWPASNRGTLLLALYFPALLLLQLLFVRSVWYYPGFDVVNVYQNAQLIAQGIAVDGSYFRLCPNNAPLTVLLAAPFWLALRAGLAVPYAILPYSGAVAANLSLLLCVLCVRKLTPSRLACWGTLLMGTVWIAFSMLITVPYTDIFSLLFPVLALYIYLSRMRLLPKWFLISLVSVFGASLKPTALIFLIALGIVTGLRYLFRRPWTWAVARKGLLVVLVMILGAVPGTLWKNQTTAYLAGSSQPQEQLSETHYLMLGMNAQTYGGHSPDDLAYSISFPDLATRRQANIARAWERLSSRTLGEHAAFFAVKTYKAFSDGMFAANHSFLQLEIPVRQDAISILLRRLFYEKGDLHPWLVTVEQGIWIGVLLLCLLAFFSGARGNGSTALMGLTLLGVAAYLLLFEVWPRYLFLYAPFFLVLAGLGLSRLPVLRLSRKTR